MSQTPEQPLGEMLVRSGVITERQLKDALRRQKDMPGVKLGAILVKWKFLTEEALVQALAGQLKLAALGLKDLTVSPQVSALLDLELVERLLMLPIRRSADSVVVAAADPQDYGGLDEVRFATGLRVEVCVAGRSDIQKAIDYYYRQRPCPALREAEAAQRAAGGRAATTESKNGELHATPSEVLQALMDLLVAKKIVTREEIRERLKRSKPV